MGKIDPEPDNRAAARRFQQNAGTFHLIEQNIVRPFQRQAFRRYMELQRQVERQGCHEAQLLGWPLKRLRTAPDAGEQVSGIRGPNTPPAASAGCLAVCTDPAFVGQTGRAFGNPVIGRSNVRQMDQGSIDWAAAAAAVASGPMASMPSGEQAMAATPIKPLLIRLSDGAYPPAGSSKYIVLMIRR